MSEVLVVNAGSSSLKYAFYRDGDRLASGLVERIGEAGGSARHGTQAGELRRDVDCADHTAAFAVALQAFADHGPDLDPARLSAVGHRVVHGGRRFWQPTVVDADVMAAIERLVPLAPLHNPGNLRGIAAATDLFPDVPQVAVFDTAFHHTIPAAAATYAVPREWEETHGVRRYGFHGTSHAYVSRRTAALLGQDPADTDVVVLHLGNGASACAVHGGASVETSMGMSPLEGLVMGTRPGDLDPAVAGHLGRVAGMTVSDVDTALSKESGLLALTGNGDFRELTSARARGDAAAELAFDVVVHRLVKYVGAYAVVLGRLDALAFTGGIGEHSAELRAAVVDGLGLLGMRLDPAANTAAAGEARITTPDSTAAFVVPTDEEGEIARQALAVVESATDRG